MKPAVSWLLGVALLASCVPGSIDVPPPAVPQQATVSRVIDGDSILVRSGDREFDVRLDAINAPDAGECLYEEASELLAGLLSGNTVRLEITGEDQFERTLAHVWVGATNVNLELVARGKAIATTPLRSGFRAAELEARSGAIGLWSPEACGTGPIPPVGIDFERSVIDPPGPDELALDEEIVFIVNHGQTTIDLGGWVVRDESSRHRFRFEQGDVLEAGETLGIRSSDPRWSPGGSPVWNNGGDIIMVLDPWGRVVAAHRY